MPRNDRQYWYDADEARRRAAAARATRPRGGRWVDLDPPVRAESEDAGHGLADQYPSRRDLPRGLPQAEPPADLERRFGYGREHFYGDPFRGDAEPGRRHLYGELYGRRERDYAHRRLPLYREPTDWSPEERRSSGFEIESDFPEVEFEGPFSGVGPRGYRRSDERILDEVADRLAHNGEVDARDVRLKVDGGEVRLEGWVESRPLKFLVEDLAASVRGVIDVDNRLRVGSAPGPAAGD